MLASGKCILLKNSFCGVFPADKFPKLSTERFILVNASPAQYEGSQIDYSFISRKQRLFGWSAWNPHTKLSNTLFPSGIVLQWGNSSTEN